MCSSGGKSETKGMRRVDRQQCVLYLQQPLGIITEIEGLSNKLIEMQCHMCFKIIQWVFIFQLNKCQERPRYNKYNYLKMTIL